MISICENVIISAVGGDFLDNFTNEHSSTTAGFVSLAAKILDIHSKEKILKDTSTGENFNIFRTLCLNHNEVGVCRLLAELLSPTGSHGQGDIFLTSFCRQVLHFEPKSSELKAVRVHREFTLNSSQRIDIVIETPHYFLPIEVKIYAADQPGQIDAYWKTTKKRQNSPKPTIYYLTLYGKEPSKESRLEVPTENIVCLSFAKDVLQWLEKISNDEKLSIAPNVLEPV